MSRTTKNPLERPSTTEPTKSLIDFRCIVEVLPFNATEPIGESNFPFGLVIEPADRQESAYADVIELDDQLVPIYPDEHSSVVIHQIGREIGRAGRLVQGRCPADLSLSDDGKQILRSVQENVSEARRLRQDDDLIVGDGQPVANKDVGPAVR